MQKMRQCQECQRDEDIWHKKCINKTKNDKIIKNSIV